MEKKYNKLSVILLIIAFLNGFGFGMIPYFLPVGRIVFGFLISILLIISFYQIFLYKQKGGALNSLNILHILILFTYNQTSINWMNDTFGKYDKPNIQIVILGVVAFCFLFAIVHSVFSKINK